MNKKDIALWPRLPSQSTKDNNEINTLLIRCHSIFRATQIEFENGVLDYNAPIFLEQCKISTNIGEMLLKDDCPLNVSFLRVLWEVYEQQLVRWSYQVDNESSSLMKH